MGIKITPSRKQTFGLQVAPGDDTIFCVEYVSLWDISKAVRCLWAKFINAEKKEEFDMLAEKDSYIDSAYSQLQVISQDKQMRMEYEAREKAIRDHNEMILEAEERGDKRGEDRGRKEGREE